MIVVVGPQNPIDGEIAVVALSGDAQDTERMIACRHIPGQTNLMILRGTPVELEAAALSIIAAMEWIPSDVGRAVAPHVDKTLPTKGHA